MMIVSTWLSDVYFWVRNKVIMISPFFRLNTDTLILTELNFIIFNLTNWAFHSTI